jgi:hypothetical protein
MCRSLELALCAGLMLVTQAHAQGSLAEAAERVRLAWLVHDAAGIVGQTASVVFQMPGADPSAPVNRSQALELLRRHLRAGVERGLSVSAVREVEPGHGYAELERRYVVAGTTDERRETVFLGFRKLSDVWVLTELRSTP